MKTNISIRCAKCANTVPYKIGEFVNINEQPYCKNCSEQVVKTVGENILASKTYIKIGKRAIPFNHDEFEHLARRFAAYNKLRKAIEQIKQLAEYECINSNCQGNCHPLCEQYKLKQIVNEALS